MKATLMKLQCSESDRNLKYKSISYLPMQTIKQLQIPVEQKEEEEEEQEHSTGGDHNLQVLVKANNYHFNLFYLKPWYVIGFPCG